MMTNSTNLQWATDPNYLPFAQEMKTIAYQERALGIYEVSISTHKKGNLLQFIFSFLSQEELKKAQRICKLWNLILNSNTAPPSLDNHIAIQNYNELKKQLITKEQQQAFYRLSMNKYLLQHIFSFLPKEDRFSKIVNSRLICKQWSIVLIPELIRYHHLIVNTILKHSKYQIIDARYTGEELNKQPNQYVITFKKPLQDPGQDVHVYIEPRVLSDYPTASALDEVAKAIFAIRVNLITQNKEIERNIHIKIIIPQSVTVTNFEICSDASSRSPFSSTTLESKKKIKETLEYSAIVNRAVIEINQKLSESQKRQSDIDNKKSLFDQSPANYLEKGVKFVWHHIIPPFLRSFLIDDGEE